MIASPLSPTAPQPIERFCDTAQLSYLSAGSGDRAVVLLHGWTSSKEVWLSALRALAPHASALAPDLPGHGGSPLLGATSMPAIARRVAAFCEARGLREIAVVGHSMGGNIALELALTRPDLVGRLVLVNPAAQGPEMPPYTRSYLLPRHGWAVMRTAFVLAGRLGALSKVVPRLRRYRYVARQDPETMRRLLGELFNNPLGGRLAEVRAPTLVISGALDPLVPTGLSRRIAEAIPQARYLRMRRAGHEPMDDCPAEFERALLEFLGYAPAAGL